MINHRFWSTTKSCVEGKCLICLHAVSYSCWEAGSFFDCLIFFSCRKKTTTVYIFDWSIFIYLPESGINLGQFSFFHVPFSLTWMEAVRLRLCFFALSETVEAEICQLKRPDEGMFSLAELAKSISFKKVRKAPLEKNKFPTRRGFRVPSLGLLCSGKFCYSIEAATVGSDWHFLEWFVTNCEYPDKGGWELYFCGPLGCVWRACYCSPSKQCWGREDSANKHKARI